MTIEDIKKALGITGEYFDDVLQVYFDTTKIYLHNAGVADEKMNIGVVARGVADLWNYGAGQGTWSKIFIDMASQLALGGEVDENI